MLQRPLSLAPQDILKVVSFNNVAHNNAPIMAHNSVALKDAPITVLNNVALKVERLGKVSLSQLMVNRDRELVLLLRINERKLLV